MKKIICIIMIYVFLNVCSECFAELKLSSPDFENYSIIPEKFTCQGENINPHLIIEGVPEGALSLALIVDDPDAPSGTWVHWVVYNIPANTRIIDNFFKSGISGINDFGREGYGGPCPPSGEHRYFFKLYALDIVPMIEQPPTKKIIEEIIAGHIIAKAELIGKYKKR